MTAVLRLTHGQLVAVLLVMAASGVPVIDPSTPEGRAKARELLRKERR